MRLTGDAAVAEDAAQEAFVRLLDDPSRDASWPRAWLFRVASNAARDALRGRTRRRRLLEEGRNRVPAARAAPDPAGLSVDPVRAWVSEQVERLGRGLGLVASSDGGARSAAASVSFVPEGGALLVRLDAHQDEGRIRVVVSRDGAGVRASVMDGSGARVPAFVVLPSQLRIRNRAGSRASYRVTVPASVETLEVRVEGRRLTRLSGEALEGGASWSWALGATAGTSPDAGGSGGTAGGGL